MKLEDLIREIIRKEIEDYFSYEKDIDNMVSEKVDELVSEYVTREEMHETIKHDIEEK